MNSFWETKKFRKQRDKDDSLNTLQAKTSQPYSMQIHKMVLTLPQNKLQSQLVIFQDLNQQSNQYQGEILAIKQTV